MANKILAFVEARDKQFRNTAFEVITEAKKLSEELSCEYEVLAICDNMDEEVKKLGAYGPSKVLMVDSVELKAKGPSGKEIKYSHSAFAKVISEVAKQRSANIVLLSASSLGKDVAPRVAVKLDAGISPDCTHIRKEGDFLAATRPVFAGKSQTEVTFTKHNVVLTLRPNVFKAEKVSDNQAEIEKLSVDSLNITDKDFGSIVTDIVISSEKLDVAEADRIVSGGRGLKGPENFNLVEDLAKTLGAATGASRAVVDAGWRDHSEQVGQTGKTVSPSLYIACGISGAIQHLAGMSSARCIVAINKDKDAPIFQVADYGIVGDAFEIIPALNDEFKKVLNN